MAKWEPDSPLAWEYEPPVRRFYAASWICQISPLNRFSFLVSTILHISRGRRYGTILVNLETRHVVGLLPDRKAETAASWMRQYPDLMAVSRDRGGDYAAAATVGAPQAIQCADRFHVIKNLGEAKDGLAGTSSSGSSQQSSQKSLVHASGSRATQSPPKTELKGSRAKPGEARGAPGPIRAGRRLAQARLLTDGYCQSSGDRSCHYFELVAQRHLPRTTTAPTKDGD